MVFVVRFCTVCANRKRRLFSLPAQFTSCWDVWPHLKFMLPEQKEHALSILIKSVYVSYRLLLSSSLNVISSGKKTLSEQVKCKVNMFITVHTYTVILFSSHMLTKSEVTISVCCTKQIRNNTPKNLQKICKLKGPESCSFKVLVPPRSLQPEWTGLRCSLSQALRPGRDPHTHTCTQKMNYHTHSYLTHTDYIICREVNKYFTDIENAQTQLHNNRAKYWLRSRFGKAKNSLVNVQLPL